MVILEGIMTTLDAEGRVNIAPMGALVDPAQERAIEQMTLRPYQGTRTLANLVRNGQGVFHVTDDVELLARAAVDRLQTVPELFPAQTIEGRVLADACRWYELRVLSIDVSTPRSEIKTKVVHRGRLRDFFGLNRAKHAVVEAAIVATRVGLLSPAEIDRGLDRLGVLVEKTGGPAEHRAFAFLREYVAQRREVQR